MLINIAQLGSVFEGNRVKKTQKREKNHYQLMSITLTPSPPSAFSPKRYLAT